MKTVNFTKAKLKALKAAYNKALQEKGESFIFEGNKYVTQFAKYLLEYFEDKFKDQK